MPVFIPGIPDRAAHRTQKAFYYGLSERLGISKADAVREFQEQQLGQSSQRIEQKISELLTRSLETGMPISTVNYQLMRRPDVVLGTVKKHVETIRSVLTDDEHTSLVKALMETEFDRSTRYEIDPKNWETIAGIWNAAIKRMEAEQNKTNTRAAVDQDSQGSEEKGEKIMAENNIERAKQIDILKRQILFEYKSLANGDISSAGSGRVFVEKADGEQAKDAVKSKGVQEGGEPYLIFSDREGYSNKAIVVTKDEVDRWEAAAKAKRVDDISKELFQDERQLSRDVREAFLKNHDSLSAISELAAKGITTQVTTNSKPNDMLFFERGDTAREINKQSLEEVLGKNEAPEKAQEPQAQKDLDPVLEQKLAKMREATIEAIDRTGGNKQVVWDRMGDESFALGFNGVSRWEYGFTVDTSFSMLERNPHLFLSNDEYNQRVENAKLNNDYITALKTANEARVEEEISRRQLWDAQATGGNVEQEQKRHDVAMARYTDSMAKLGEIEGKLNKDGHFVTEYHQGLKDQIVKEHDEKISKLLGVEQKQEPVKTATTYNVPQDMLDTIDDIRQQLHYFHRGSEEGFDGFERREQQATQAYELGKKVSDERSLGRFEQAVEGLRSSLYDLGGQYGQHEEQAVYSMDASRKLYAIGKQIQALRPEPPKLVDSREDLLTRIAELEKENAALKQGQQEKAPEPDPTRGHPQGAEPQKQETGKEQTPDQMLSDFERAHQQMKSAVMDTILPYLQTQLEQIDEFKKMVTDLHEQLNQVAEENKQMQMLRSTMHTMVNKIDQMQSGLAVGLQGFPPYLKDNSQVKGLIEKHQQELIELKELAYSDNLTKLGNRNQLDKVLHEKEGTYVGFSMDIDHFKKINDTFGHDTGDEVLRKVADTTKATVQGHSDREVHLFRLGGEEIGVLVKVRNEGQKIPEAEIKAVTQMAERVRAAIERTGQCTVSIGVSNQVTKLPLSNREAADFKNTFGDDNLYKAKSDGRNQVVSPAKVDRINQQVQQEAERQAQNHKR